jgi:ATP-dependent DNA helicase PIF1
LFSKNQEVNKLNEEELAELPGNSFFFYSQDKENISGKLKDLVKNCLSPEVLELKVGAQVMLIKN